MEHKFKELMIAILRFLIVSFVSILIGFIFSFLVTAIFGFTNNLDFLTELNLSPEDMKIITNEFWSMIFKILSITFSLIFFIIFNACIEAGNEIQERDEKEKELKHQIEVLKNEKKHFKLDLEVKDLETMQYLFLINKLQEIFFQEKENVKQELFNSLVEINKSQSIRNKTKENFTKFVKRYFNEN